MIAPTKSIVQAATTKQNLLHQQICQNLILCLDHTFKNVVNLKTFVHSPNPFSCQIVRCLEVAYAKQYKVDV